jgi:D-3-phosphoglycerate dehydrogenase
MRVALTDPIEPVGEDILRAAGHEILHGPGTGATPDALRALCAAADAVIVRQKLPDDLPEHAPRLRAAVRQGVGVDLIPVDACTAAGVLVANVPGANADAVAEFVVAQMLAAARQAQAMHARLLAGPWDAARGMAARATELNGKVLGIVGVGAIGTRLAEIAHHGLRMRVLGRRRNAGRLPAFVTAADLPTLFAQSDFIALACPLTEETRGLASAAMIARMKPGAWLMNVARGGVVDEPALVAALREGRIGGAALDVYAAQPLAPDHELRHLPNVVLTPHVAGLSVESVVTMSTIAAEEVVLILRGERPRNFINPTAWDGRRMP